MTEPREKILELKNVRLYFSSGFGKRKVVVKAVHNISFDVYKGEVFGLVGESGCGKTTTGRAIIKLYNLTDGQIYFKSRLISEGNRGKNLEIKRLRKEIRDKKKETANVIAELKGEGEMANVEKINTEINEAKAELNRFIAEQKQKIAICVGLKPRPEARKRPRFEVDVENADDFPGSDRFPQPSYDG